jgi:hypothetical protein
MELSHVYSETMKSTLVALVAVVTALGSPGVVAARALQTPSQAQTGELTVKVTGRDLTKWEGPVKLKDAAGNEVQTIDTKVGLGVTGEVTFKNLPPGTYTVEIAGTIQTVEVAAGVTTVVNSTVSVESSMGQQSLRVTFGDPFFLGAAGLAAVGVTVALANRGDSSPSR